MLLTLAVPLFGIAAGPSVEALRATTVAEPDNGRAWVNLGRAELRAGNPQAAEAACRRAVKLDPEAWRAEMCVGEALLAQRRWDEAEATLGNVVQQAQRDPRPLLAIGQGALDRKQYKAAAVAFRTADGLCRAPEEPDPQDPPDRFPASVCVEATLKLGFALKKMEDWAGAEAALRRTLELDPDNYYAHLNLGTVLRHERDLAGARAAYEAATRARPQAPQAWFNLGNLDRVEGDWPAAAAHHVRAFELATDRPDLGLQALGSAVSAEDGAAARRVLEQLQTLELTKGQKKSMERLRRRLPPEPETGSKPASPDGR